MVGECVGWGSGAWARGSGAARRWISSISYVDEGLPIGAVRWWSLWPMQALFW